MSEPQIIDGIESCGAIALLWLFWQACWRRSALDKFRQTVFGIRDDMFLAIAKGNSPIGFESPEYLRCRRDLNQIIRCAPNVSLTMLLWTLILQKFIAPEYTIADFSYSESVIEHTTNPKIKSFVEPFQERLNFAVIEFLLTSSIGFIAVTFFVGFLGLLITAFLAVRDLLKNVDWAGISELPAAVYKKLGAEGMTAASLIVDLILLSQRDPTPALAFSLK